MPGRRRKEHEPHHVRAGIQRDVERLARGQAANFDDQGHVSGHGLGWRQDAERRCAVGRVLQRRALLVSPAGPIEAALRREPEGAADRTARMPRGARRSASCARACRASASCWRAARRQCRCRNQVAEPPATTPAIATAMMTTNSGRVTAIDGSVGIERIERHRHQMPVGDREDDEDQAQRNQHQQP